MKRSSLVHLLFFLLALITFSGCQQEATKATIDDYLPLRVGETSLEAQLAITTPERARGLMHRHLMEENHGMLFVFEAPQRMSFYMRNTYIPLDIGYFDREGTLREIYRMYPHDETPIRSRSEEIMYALEMNQGWYSRNGIRTGAKLDLALLEKALKARNHR